VHSRRRFLRDLFRTAGMALGTLIISPWQVCAAGADRSPLPRARTGAVTRLPEHSLRPTLALSVSALQAEAARLQQARQPLPEALVQLGGMNRIHGVTIEPDGELVLLGEHDASLPPLHLDDLCIAMRNAYQVSSVYQGAPGCSIDPSPGAKDPWQIQTVRLF